MKKIDEWIYFDGHMYNIKSGHLVYVGNLPKKNQSRTFIASDHFSTLCTEQPFVLPQKHTAHNILALEITNRCNYACKYCFEGESCNNTDVLDLNTAISAIRELPIGSEIRFFGGEPLLEYDLVKTIVENSPGMRYSIVTNGSLIDNCISQFLAENDFSVAVSYDGCYWQEKNRIPSCGNSAFDAKNAVAVLKTQNAFTGISTTLTKESIPHLYDIHLEVFADLEADAWAYLLAYSSDMTMHDLDVLKSQIMQIVQDFPAHHLIKINDLRSWAMKASRTWPIEAFCGAGKCYSALTVHGEKRICPFFLRESSCYGPSLRTREVDCKHCYIWQHCHGGCLSLNMFGTGNTHKGHPFACKKNHIYFEAGLATLIKTRKEGIRI